MRAWRCVFNHDVRDLKLVDAIVVVENIYRHSAMGKDIETSIIDGSSEVFLPVVAATLTTCAAFMPMLIMTGSIGDFFAIIPKAISFAQSPEPINRSSTRMGRTRALDSSLAFPTPCP